MHILDRKEQLVERFLRKQYRKLKLSGETEKASAILAVIDDPDGLYLSAITHYVEVKSSYDEDDLFLGTSSADASGSFLENFLKFLTDHFDEIVKFIQLLLTLI